MTDFAIRTEDLSKLYRIGVLEQRSETLVGSVFSLLQAPVRNYRKLRSLTVFREADTESDDVIWALRDVCSEVKEGEVLGIIGTNGAGKSTFLKILASITEPTNGRALVRGRVASLLEVGTGFHPDLTGRENVYLNGTILGMTKIEIDQRFDEIVSFSGVEKFIDTPVKRFSSGMKVRLAFAVAAHLEPDILLVDEVLAVGDAAFQKKCLGKMSTVAGEGRTVLFVSHNLSAVTSLCEQGLLFDRGRIAYCGGIEETVRVYENSLQEKEEAEPSTVGQSRAVVCRALRVAGEEDQLTPASTLTFEWRAEVRLPHWEMKLQLSLMNATGLYVALPVVDSNAFPMLLDTGTYSVRVRMPPLWLSPGPYSARVKVYAERPGDSGRHFSDTIRFRVLPPAETVAGGAQILDPTCEWSIRRTSVAKKEIDG